MHTAVLSNISTPLSIVNSAQGRAIRVVPDPNSMYIPYISTYSYREAALTTDSQILSN